MFENIKSSLAFHSKEGDDKAISTPLKRNIQDVSARLNRYINRVREMEAQHNRAFQEKKELEKRLADFERNANGQIDNLKQDNDEFKRSLIESEKNFQEIKAEHHLVTDLLSTEKSKAIKTDKELTEKTNELMKLKPMVEALKAKCNEYENAIGDLTVKLSNYDQLSMNATADRVKQTARVQELEQNVADLSKLLSKKDALIVNNDKIMGEIKGAQSKEVELLRVKYNKDLQTALDEASTRFDGLLESYKQDITVENAATLQKTKEDMQREFEVAHNTHATQMQSIKEKYDALDAHNKECRRAIAELEIGVKTASELQQQTAAKYTAMGNELASSRMVIADLEKENNKLKQINGEAALLELEKANRVIEAMKEQLHSVNAQNKENLAEIETLKGEVQEQAQMLGMEESRLGMNGPVDNSAPFRISPHPSSAKKTFFTRSQGTVHDDTNNSLDNVLLNDENNDLNENINSTNSANINHGHPTKVTNASKRVKRAHPDSTGTNNTNNITALDQTAHKLIDNITGDVFISEIEANGCFVRLKNTRNQPIALAGWAITDNCGNKFYFPESQTIGVNETITIYTAFCDEETRTATATQADLFWNERPAWTANGGSVYLVNSREEDVSRAIFDDLSYNPANSYDMLNNTSRCKTQ